MQTTEEPSIKTRRSPFCDPSKRHVARKLRKANRTPGSHVFDLKKISAWAQVGCTLEEIAGLLGVSSSWLNVQKDKDGDLEDAILLGGNNFKQSLRSCQARLALSGHPAMLIWLGKQFLGQSDKQENKTETTVNITLQKAMEEVRALDTDMVLQMKRMIEEKKPPLIINDGSVSEGIVESQ